MVWRNVFVISRYPSGATTPSLSTVATASSMMIPGLSEPLSAALSDLFGKLGGLTKSIFGGFGDTARQRS